MPVRKVSDLPGCHDPDHHPLTETERLALAPGIYEHTCPACNNRTRFTVCPRSEPCRRSPWYGRQTHADRQHTEWYDRTIR